MAVLEQNRMRRISGSCKCTDPWYHQALSEPMDSQWLAVQRHRSMNCFGFDLTGDMNPGWTFAMDVNE